VGRVREKSERPVGPLYAVPFFLHKLAQLPWPAVVSEARATVRRAYIGALYASVWSGCQCAAKFKIRPHGP